MQNRPSELARHVSKLISAIQKQWMEELGEPEAPATEAALQSAQRLLTAIRDGSIARLLADGTIGQHLGGSWIATHPWAKPHVQKIESAIRTAFPENARFEGNDGHSP
jgi:hypothetical protein